MKCKEIAEFLEKELYGEDIEISGYSSLSGLKSNTLVFAKKYTDDFSKVLSSAKSVLAIVCEEYADKLSIPYILSNNPRLDYLRVVSEFFTEEEFSKGIHPTAIVEEGAVIGTNVFVGAHCFIGAKVKIGDNTIILPNTSIYGKVTIGERCYIKPGVVIGGPGFGFENDENGVPVHFPHTGEVVIGNNVYIGANTAIDRATIDATIIEDNVKIDNLVLVGHNSHIEANTMIAGGTVLCGGSHIGKGTWVSPNASVLQHLNVGDDAMVGIGAVVVQDVQNGCSVFGNPARFIGKNK